MKTDFKEGFTKTLDQHNLSNGKVLYKNPENFLMSALYDFEQIENFIQYSGVD